MQSLEITSVIKRLKSSDEATAAFDCLIERYSERLYWHCRRIVVLHEDSQDALQDAFVTAFLSVAQFRGETESSLTAWLYKIATTSAIKVLKRRRKHIFASIDSVSAELATDFETLVAEDGDTIAVRLQRAVLKLPVKQRLVFNMRYYDELTFEQISSITSQSVSTLKTNYHYAVKRIKESVAELDYE